MSNSIELLYFIQQKSPLYVQSMEEELDVTGEPSGRPAQHRPQGDSGGLGHACLHRVEPSWPPGQPFGDHT
jgi:hypothetical protein